MQDPGCMKGRILEDLTKYSIGIIKIMLYDIY
jgi:hypothetical protein